MRRGDCVCVLLGCTMPMVLRPIGGHFELVGEVYMPGIMQGEGLAALKEGKKVSREFELH